jgi:hypothetical protein
MTLSELELSLRLFLDQHPEYTNGLSQEVIAGMSVAEIVQAFLRCPKCGKDTTPLDELLLYANGMPHLDHLWAAINELSESHVCPVDPVQPVLEQQRPIGGDWRRRVAEARASRTPSKRWKKPCTIVEEAAA